MRTGLSTHTHTHSALSTVTESLLLGFPSKLPIKGVLTAARRSFSVFSTNGVVCSQELLSDGPAAATPATVPRSRRGQGGEPAVLRPPPVPSRAPAGAAHLEPPAPTSWPAGRLTFHPLCTHHGARDETSTGSLLCSCVSHDATLLAQADLTAPVLGILMTEGQILCFIIFCFVLLTLYFFFFRRRSLLPLVFFFSFFFKARLFCDEQLSCFVLYLFDFCNKKKKDKFLLFKYICIWWYSEKGSGLLFILTC